MLECPARVKVLAKTKDVGRPGSRALYAATSCACQPCDSMCSLAVERGCANTAVVDNRGVAQLDWQPLPHPSPQPILRAPVAENSAVYSSLWIQCARALEAELSEQQFNTWIRPLQLVEDGGLLQVAGAESLRRRLGENTLSRANPRVVDAA